MPEPSAPSVAHKLEQLRQRFREKAAIELEGIRRRVTAMSAGKADSGDLSFVYQSLHRLAGSGGTFGFPELGRLARGLEVSLKPLVEAYPGGDIPPEQLCTVLNDAFRRDVEHLIRCLAEENGTGDPGTMTTEAGRPLPAEVAEPLILLLAPDSEASRELSQGLALHGFRVCRVEDPGQADPHTLLAGVSALILYEWDAASALPAPAPGTRLPPGICLGREDSFRQRYTLAEKGADGFLPCRRICRCWRTTLNA